MLAVRFSADVIETVKRFAAEDGVTVSTWIRRLIDREVKNPMRPVGFRLYPTTRTTGAPVDVKWDIWPSGSGSVTK